MRVGIIGIGIMGNIIGKSFLSAGHEVVAYDLKPESAAALLQSGAVWAGGPKEIALSSEIIVTSLPSQAAIEKVVLSDGEGIVNHMAKGSVLIDMSTSSPALARKLFDALSDKGLHALDAPLSNRGTYITVGGERDIFDFSMPVLSALSDYVFFMGGAGMGQVAKLVRQYVGFVTFAAEAEALLIAKKYDLDLSTMVKFLEMSVEGPSHLGRVWPAILKNDFESVGAGSVNIVGKDIHLGVELGELGSTPVVLGRELAEAFEAAQENGWGEEQWYRVVEIFEKKAGIKIREP